jgi:hypothetical protein
MKTVIFFNLSLGLDFLFFSSLCLVGAKKSKLRTSKKSLKFCFMIFFLAVDAFKINRLPTRYVDLKNHREMFDV